MSDLSEKAKRNRELFPETAAFIDALRAEFGQEVKPTYICEGGRTVRKSVNEKPGTWVGLEHINLDTRSREQVIADMKAKGQW